MSNFKKTIQAGIPEKLPPKKDINPNISHAPRRKDILNKEEKQLAIRNALRYFPKNMHSELAIEFKDDIIVGVNNKEQINKLDLTINKLFGISKTSNKKGELSENLVKELINNKYPN